MQITSSKFNQDNLKYLKSFLGDEDVDIFLLLEGGPEFGTPEARQTFEKVLSCLTAMDEYGENRWWLSKDKKVLGYYQLKTNILLISYPQFIDSLTHLLGRSVSTIELGLNRDCLMDEAEKAFKS